MKNITLKLYIPAAFEAYKRIKMLARTVHTPIIMSSFLVADARLSFSFGVGACIGKSFNEKALKDEINFQINS